MQNKFKNYLIDDPNTSTIQFFDVSEMSEQFKTSTANADLIIVVSISFLFLMFAMMFDLYEQLYQWSRKYDLFEIDEVILLALVLFPGLIWFAVRRWREAVRSYKKTVEAKNILETVRQQQDELIKENRSLYRKISNAQEEERKRIAMDLHDIFGQHLTAIHANASTVKLKTDNAALVKQLSERIIKSSGQLSLMARLMLNELRSPVLENIGLDAAIKNYITDWLENHHEFTIDYSSEGDDQGLSESLALIFYRSLQESLTNIVKHAKAQKITVSVNFSVHGEHSDASYVSMQIHDDGCGFEYPDNKNGLGLVGIRERVLNAGGELTIDSKADLGTTLKIRISKAANLS